MTQNSQNAGGASQPDVKGELAKAEATRAAAQSRMFKRRLPGPKHVATPAEQRNPAGVKVETNG